jgi:hypothetical protein
MRKIKENNVRLENKFMKERKERDLQIRTEIYVDSGLEELIKQISVLRNGIASMRS